MSPSDRAWALRATPIGGGAARAAAESKLKLFRKLQWDAWDELREMIGLASVVGGAVAGMALAVVLAAG
jgi:hypothetical protein